ncbi:MAG TPA: MBG domain-containing protein, partial [Gammaproteobacteria bacterium]|nr:MBG domain-containing protein [Gammaproteobacteria bacterium]
MRITQLLKWCLRLWVLVSFLFGSPAGAVPQNGQVVAGSAAISQVGPQTTINQTSQNAVINWQGFNTASNESVKFNQPNASSIALNRITSGLPTTFAGSLSANGQVWIVNPAGVLFTSTSRIDVAGLLATTHDITNANFMNGHYQFDAVPGFENSKIINNGLISIKDSGLAALVAPGVENNGIIQANLGRVALSSGSAFVLDLYGDQLINFGTSPAVQNGYVSNSGKITATGGKVFLTANSAAQVVDNVISMSGTIEATTASTGQHGEIILNGGHSGATRVSGKLNASNGGHIETSGDVLIIEPSAEINAGAGGSWLLDPRDITINSGSGLSHNSGAPAFTPTSNNSIIGATLIANQLSAGTSVTIDTGASGGQNGDISITSSITDSQSSGSSPTLTFNAAGAITFTGGAGTTISSAGAIPFNVVFNAASVALSSPINVGTANVSITTTGAITQTATGTITAGLLTTNSGAGTALSTATSSISRFNATNSGGAISLANSIPLNITGITQSAAAGTLTITNTGAITQSGGIISVTGASSFAAGAANNITLGSNNALTGAVTIVSGNTVTLNNNIALSLAASTISGNLIASTVPASNASITQTGILTVAGTSNFSVGGAVITLGSNNLFSGAVSLNNTGANAVSIKNVTNLILGTSVVGQNLTVTTTGNSITQTGTLTVPGTSSFTAGANLINLSLGNTLTGAVTLSNSGATNPVTLNNTIATTLPVTTVGGVLTITSGGNLTLNGALTSGATSGQRSIILSAPSLINNVGAAVLVPGAGNTYVVYLSNVTGNTFNSLASGNQAIWNKTIGTLVPGSVPSGNRYVFANQPSVTVTTTSTSKAYGTDLTGTVGILFSVSAFVNAATYGNVFTQDTTANALTGVAPTSLGAAATATVSGSPYAVTSAATSTTGYAVVLNNAGTITVTPKALTITANNQSKVYGSLFTFAGTEFTSNGLVNADSISSITLTSAATPVTATVAGSSYPIVGSAAVGSGLGNYTIAYTNGSFAVTPKALTITANNQSKVYGSLFTFAGTEFTSNGLVNADSISSITLTSAATPVTATVAGSSYPIVGSAAVGSGLSNYTIAYTNGSFAVTPKALTITANNQTKVYGSAFTFAG